MKNNKNSVIPEGELIIAAFRGKKVRRVLHDNEWYFSVVDFIAALSESTQPRRYWRELKVKLSRIEGYDQLFDNIEQLKMPSSDGKEYMTDTANTETIFRIIQSIPSKKAEPFKRWLARVGYERILEYQNPGIAIKRAAMEYKIQGRSDEWVDARVRSILVRNELTSEWGRRGIRESQHYAALTDFIQKGTFGLSTKQHKGLKQLGGHHNLRDDMTSMEVIFMMLGEKSTRDIAISTNAQGLNGIKMLLSTGAKLQETPGLLWKRRRARRWFRKAIF